MFLKPFANGIEAEEGQEPAMKWAHIDIAGAMEVSPSDILCFSLRSQLTVQTINMISYMEKGMSGRPVR